MRLLCALPCFNEAESLPGVLARLPRSLPGVEAIEVVVVDDGSTDGSAEVAEEAGIEVVRHGRNLGVGAAFRTGVGLALARRADLLVWLDADGQFDPADIPALLAPILAGCAGMTTGSRFLDRALVSQKMPRAKLYGNLMMAHLVSFLLGTRYHDVSCGFRAFSRDALLRLELYGRFTYTQETILKLSRHRVPIREVPLRIAYFEGRRSRVASSLPRYGAHALAIIVRCYRDCFPVPFYASLSGLFLLLGAPLIAFLLRSDLEGRPPPAAIAAGVLGVLCVVSAVLGRPRQDRVSAPRDAGS